MKIFSKIGTVRRLVTNNLIDKGIYSKDSHKRLVIVMYHGIDLREETRFNQRFYSRASFEKHLIAFRKHFHIMNYAELKAGNHSTKKPNLLLTFDDGYANNYRHALPLLDKYGVHAFFFVTGLANAEQKILWADAVDIVSHHARENDKVALGGHDFYFHGGQFISGEHQSLPDYVRTSRQAGYTEKEQLLEQLLAIYDFTRHRELDDHWQLMTNEEIHKCAQSRNITIGSHGFFHNNLGSLDNADAVDEVMKSKAYLEGVTQHEVTSIGFPDGSYTEELNDSLYKSGITHQFVVDYRYNDAGKRDFTYDRFGLYPNMGNTHKLMYKILHL